MHSISFYVSNGLAAGRDWWIVFIRDPNKDTKGNMYAVINL